MVAYDFEYDGILLSDMGCMLCVIDTSLDNSITVGTDITFNVAKAFDGKRFYSTHTTYDSPLTETYEICKKCNSESKEFTLEEVREITKWLKRLNKHKLKFIGEEFNDFYLEASFNVYSIEKSGKIIGLQLNMEASTAYPIHEPIRLSFVSRGSNSKIHVWKKYTLKKGIDETEESDVSVSFQMTGGTSGNSFDYVDYSNYIDVVDGSLSLVNPTKILVNSQETAELLIGKYVKLYASNDLPYYRIPSNSTASRKSTSGSLYSTVSYIVSTAYKLSVGTGGTKGSYIETVTSNDSTKYPSDGESGGYWYVYQGISNDDTIINNAFSYTIKNESDEEGILYPDVKITALKDGDINLSIIHNKEAISTTVIKNCISGEILTLSYPMISSSVSTHNISDDFNWEFPIFANEYANSKNTISIPSSCRIDFVYTPVVKVSL